MNLTHRDKGRVTENAAHQCVDIVIVLKVKRAQNLHCRSSAITLQAASHLCSSNDAGKGNLSAAPSISDRSESSGSNLEPFRRLC